MNQINLHKKMSSYMPLFMAWVLSCLIVNASFEVDKASAQPGFSEQSPLAQYQYTSKNYSLRFAGSKLTGHDDEVDAPDLVVSPFFALSTGISPPPALAPTAVVSEVSRYRAKPRGPPAFLS
ncbi:hypothetical protein [Alteromonas ponticola]|uniref:Uncharacterized protein n=1 Tax=Alteromonas ponticola TaxID=2720613 RepID=A0ABX1R2A8_9ALTE|nr:hypothetical protein [Alteromonas ponticola]NMH60585.1 hypothetical protein [Alteromonas ponticola]